MLRRQVNNRQKRSPLKRVALVDLGFAVGLGCSYLLLPDSAVLLDFLDRVLAVGRFHLRLAVGFYYLFVVVRI